MKKAADSTCHPAPVISVVIPVYNEEMVVEACYRRLGAVLDALGTSYELVFVNDGSSDQSRAILDRLIDRRVCDALKSLGEHNRYVRGLIAWLGFRQTFVPFDRAPRMAGATKYPMSKMIRFAVDGLTAFSRKPLQLASYLGFLSSLGGFLALGWVLYTRLFTTNAVEGWASLLGIDLLFFGLLFLVLGIMGAYLGRLYEEAKGRPHYLIDEIREHGSASRLSAGAHP